VKVWIDMDEWYPVYTVYQGNLDLGLGQDVDDETVARWLRVTADFEAVQAEMETVIESRLP